MPYMTGLVRDVETPLFLRKQSVPGTDYVGIQDIIHVVEYLWIAGNAMHGENHPETKKQVYKWLLSNLQGNVGRVIVSLKQMLTKRNKMSKSKRDAIEKVIRYFENHQIKLKLILKNALYPLLQGCVI